jgi:soluble lytic murein transglycosylase-like protein
MVLISGLIRLTNSTGRQKRNVANSYGRLIVTSACAIFLMMPSGIGARTDIELLNSLSKEISNSVAQWNVFRERMKSAKFRPMPRNLTIGEERIARGTVLPKSSRLNRNEERVLRRKALLRRSKTAAEFPEFLISASQDSAHIQRLKATCAQYFPEFDKTSAIFDVPKQILYGLAYHESGCDPQIGNKVSTASGLGQILDGTWSWIKKETKRDLGIELKDRLEPHDNLLAAGWYLNYLFRLAERRHTDIVWDRGNPQHWQAALGYYYAGPNCQGRPACWTASREVSTRKYTKNVLSLARALS